MKLFEVSLGLMDESDIVSLSPDLHMLQKALVDSKTGSQLGLHVKAHKILSKLKRPTSAVCMLDYARTYDVSDEELGEIIRSINNIGGWNIQRNTASKLRMAYRRLGRRIIGISLETATRRQTASLYGLLKIVTLACLPIFAGFCLLGVLLYGANFESTSILSGTIFILITLWASTVAHEYTHVLLLPRDTPRVLVWRGLRIGVVHQATPTINELASAVLGPLCGIASALGLGLLMAQLSHDQLFAAVGTLVALFHLLSWMPSYGDGETLVKQIKQRQKHEKLAI